MPEPIRVEKGGERYYDVDGDEYPSVTTILNAYKPKKKKIDNWRQRLRSEGKDPDAVRDRAALRGTLAHHRILNEYAIRELPLPEFDVSDVDDELLTDVETCVALWEQLDFEIANDAHIEKKVWSHKHGYAGTLDALTGGVVVDLKTSKAAFDSHKMQIAAYYHATHELHQLPDATGAAIVVLHPDEGDITGTIHWLTDHEIEHWFGKFLDVLSDYKQQERLV